LSDQTPERGRDQARGPPAGQIDAHLDNLPLAVVGLDEKGRVVRWAAQAETLFGWTGEEVLGRTLEALHLIHPDDRARVLERLADMVGRSVSCRFVQTNRNLTRDGRVLTCEWVNSVLFDAQGQLVSMLSFATDVSARIEAKTKLDQNRALLAIAGRTARLGGWRLDLEAGRVSWSDEVAAIHALPPGTSPSMQEGIGFYVPECRERIANLVSACIERGEPFDDELQIVDANGKRVWVRAIGEPERNPDGRVIAIQGAFQDISERKLAEQKASELAERLGNTLESISDAFLTVDREWNVTFLNRRAEQLLQHERSALLGRNIWEAFPAAAQTKFYQRGHEAMDQRQTVRYEEFYPEPLNLWFNVAAYPTEEGLAVYFSDQTERRQAQQDAAEHAERMRAVLESASDAVITVNEAGLIESVNPATERIFGYSSDEMLGQNIRMLMPHDRASMHDNYVRRYVETGQARILGEPQKLKARHRNGREFPIELTVSEVFLSGRRVFTGFIQDISREEQALEILRSDEQRFRAVAQATTDAVWDYDVVTNTVWWSDGLTAVFGYPQGEVSGELDWWASRIHPEDREAVERSLDEAVRQCRSDWSASYRFKRHDGTYAQVVDSGFTIMDQRGKPRRMVGGLKDITESQRARQKLAEQAALLDLARDAIIVRDLDNRITYWNKGAERIYGWSTEEAVGQSAVELLGPDPEFYREAYERVLVEGRVDRQYRHRCKDGREIAVQSHWILVTDETGSPKSIMAINTDISNQLELEAQLRQAQRLESIGQLTGGVAHDFNNLLTVILGNAELLGQSLASDPELKSLADMTQAAARRGAELTSRLLAFARRQALEPESTDIARLVDNMQPLLRRSIPEHIEIRTRHERGLWRAEIDPAQLESALLNLALNARDAMEQGGLLTIDTRNIEVDEDYADNQADMAPGDYVLVTVSDTGHGVPRDQIGRLFEPFFTTKEKGKGTGLGLAMVYGFVKQSSGHVKLYSEPGEGTTIRIYLPRSLRPASGPARANQEQAEVNGNERILVVEDDQLVREHAERLLKHLGYQVQVAADGDQALAILQQDAGFDLLFTDVIMPGKLNGPALADEALRIRPNLKVLFTSGYTEDAIIHQGRLDQGVLLLSKPYRRLDLARKVREALDGVA
jgi:PAS domain S-box-containing protein